MYYILRGLNSRFLQPGIFHELGICKLRVGVLKLLINEIIKFNSQFTVSLLGNTTNWEGFFLKKSSQIRDFQEINTKSRISGDSELGGFTV